MRFHKILFQGRKKSNLSNIPTFAELAFCVAPIYPRQQLEKLKVFYIFTLIRFDRNLLWSVLNLLLLSNNSIFETRKNLKHFLALLMRFDQVLFISYLSNFLQIHFYNTKIKVQPKKFLLKRITVYSRKGRTLIICYFLPRKGGITKQKQNGQKSL